MRALAEAVSITPGKTGFSCYDPTLAQRLRQAAKQAAEPAVLRLRKVSFTEGAAGVANAVKNLWGNIGRYLSSLVRFVVSWGDSSASGTTSSGEPITGRDLIALLATIGVDFGLFVLTVLNPPVRTLRTRPLDASMRRQLGQAIGSVIRRTNTDQEWVRRHFIHHRAASYFVIPNLYSSDPGKPGEDVRALAMNQLAGMLVDLDLVRWPTKKEGRALKKEEQKLSDTDLSTTRKKRLEQLKKEGIELDKEKEAWIEAATPLRNHGLFSKAEHMLETAGWSKRARADIEVFVLVDAEGLTPLLAVLNDRLPEDNAESATTTTETPPAAKPEPAI